MAMASPVLSTVAISMPGLLVRILRLFVAAHRISRLPEGLAGPLGGVITRGWIVLQTLVVVGISGIRNRMKVLEGRR